MEATVTNGTDSVPQPTATAGTRQPALIALLRDRFQLRAHVEQRQQLSMVLLVAPGGPKLKLAGATSGEVTDGGRTGIVVGHAGTMSMLASHLDAAAGGHVLDETGLGGRYDFTLAWNPTVDASVLPSNAGNPTLGKTFQEQCQRGQVGCVYESDVPSLRTALEQELGLTLERIKHPTDAIIVDHVVKP